MPSILQGSHQAVTQHVTRHYSRTSLKFTAFSRVHTRLSHNTSHVTTAVLHCILQGSHQAVTQHVTRHYTRTAQHSPGFTPGCHTTRHTSPEPYFTAFSRVNTTHTLSLHPSTTPMDMEDYHLPQHMMYGQLTIGYSSRGASGNDSRTSKRIRWLSALLTSTPGKLALDHSSWRSSTTARVREFEL